MCEEYISFKIKHFLCFENPMWTVNKYRVYQNVNQLFLYKYGVLIIYNSPQDAVHISSAQYLYLLTMTPLVLVLVHLVKYRQIFFGSRNPPKSFRSQTQFTAFGVLYFNDFIILLLPQNLILIYLQFLKILLKLWQNCCKYINKHV